jgi:hypothetical protein
MRSNCNTRFTLLASLVTLLISVGLLLSDSEGSLWERCCRVWTEMQHHKLLTLALASLAAFSIGLFNETSSILSRHGFSERGFKDGCCFLIELVNPDAELDALGQVLVEQLAEGYVAKSWSRHERHPCSIRGASRPRRTRIDPCKKEVICMEPRTYDHAPPPLAAREHLPPGKWQTRGL